LLQGIAAAKAGDLDEAYHYLEWVLRKPASTKQQSQAWLWLSEVYVDPVDKRECLAHALAIEPNNALARRQLALLDGRLKQQDIVDPDSIATDRKVDAAPEAARAKRFQCPRCSGRMHFTPDGQHLSCEFCDYRGDPRGKDADPGSAYNERGWGMERDFIVGLATARGHLEPVLMKSFHCQGCGVEFILAPESLSLTCPYCDAVYVTEAADERESIPPHAIIPFATTQEQASHAAVQWLKGHQIKGAILSPLTGFYIPVWTFDMSGEIGWSGMENRGDRRVPASGKHFVWEDDRRVLATNSVAAGIRNAINDFDLDLLLPYEAAYLAAWPAELNQITLAKASLIARKELLDELRKDSYSLTNGQTISKLRLNSSGLAIDSYKLILLPLWLGHYQKDARKFELVVNGKTARVRGERETGIFRRLSSWLRGA
jgi:hypothetical protein